MLHSMTGYGRSVATDNIRTITVEMKSLNGKGGLDINLRAPLVYNEMEMDMRRLLTNELHRGNIIVNIQRTDNSGGEAHINKAVVVKYLLELKEIAIEYNQDQADLLSHIVRLPDVMQSANNGISDDETQLLLSTLKDAISKLMDFRKKEGEVLRSEMELRVKNILNFLAEVVKLDDGRKQRAKNDLLTKLKEVALNVDQNRFEQELIYHFERLDISEEITRLRTHCNYFVEILNNQDVSKGKKLGFITQEMGREINTTGSKANDAAMQQWVVQMKDELEKIKEQALNVL